MLFADSLTPTQVIVIGFLSLLFAGLMVWRTRLARRLRAEGSATISRRDHREASEAVERVSSHVDRFELRLYEYNREVEARIETRLAQLDQLVLSADREICRLQNLLQKKDSSAPSPGPDIVTNAPASTASLEQQSGLLTPWQRRMVLHLADAGYNTREISVLLGRPEEEISAALELERRLQSRGAA